MNRDVGLTVRSRGDVFETAQADETRSRSFRLGRCGLGARAVASLRRDTDRRHWSRWMGSWASVMRARIVDARRLRARIPALHPGPGWRLLRAITRLVALAALPIHKADLKCAGVDPTGCRFRARRDCAPARLRKRVLTDGMGSVKRVLRCALRGEKPFRSRSEVRVWELVVRRDR